MSASKPALYVPGNRSVAKLVSLMNGENPLQRLIVCIEDSIADHHVEQAVGNIKAALCQMDANSQTEVFIRLRDHGRTMDTILGLDHLEKVRGFVIPKAHPTGLPKYAEPIIRLDMGHKLLPIIEHKRIPSSQFRSRLLGVCMDYRDHIDCIRIGGNDLLGHQGLRRANRVTVYDTVIGKLIADIVNEFRGIGGFEVTAPVFEMYDKRFDRQLKRELKQSIANGLLGQTVIHPRHMAIILEAYKVTKEELVSAREMVGSNIGVVGKFGRMDEPATHSLWAERILTRAELFGVRDSGLKRIRRIISPVTPAWLRDAA
jgi:citrate lyase beta subunit